MFPLRAFGLPPRRRGYQLDITVRLSVTGMTHHTLTHGGNFDGADFGTGTGKSGTTRPLAREACCGLSTTSLSRAGSNRSTDRHQLPMPMHFGGLNDPLRSPVVDA